MIIDGDQFFGVWRIVEDGIRFARDRLQKTLVNVPAQADRINWHTLNRRRVNAFFAAVAADIAIFAAIAQDNDRLARQRRRNSMLNAQTIGVIERRLPAGIKLINHLNQPRLVSGVINQDLKIRVKDDQRHSIIGAQCANIASRRRLGLLQRPPAHAAAGVNHQYTGKSQAVVGDILHPADGGRVGQIAANAKVVRLQPRNKLAAGVQYADVDRHAGQISRINANDVQRDARFVLRPRPAKKQQHQRRHHSPSQSLHLELLQCV